VLRFSGFSRSDLYYLSLFLFFFPWPVVGTPFYNRSSGFEFCAPTRPFVPFSVLPDLDIANLRFAFADMIKQIMFFDLLSPP